VCGKGRIQALTNIHGTKNKETIVLTSRRNLMMVVLRFFVTLPCL